MAGRWRYLSRATHCLLFGNSSQAPAEMTFIPNTKLLLSANVYAGTLKLQWRRCISLLNLQTYSYPCTHGCECMTANRVNPTGIITSPSYWKIRLGTDQTILSSRHPTWCTRCQPGLNVWFNSFMWGSCTTCCLLWRKWPVSIRTSLKIIIINKSFLFQNQFFCRTCSWSKTPRMTMYLKTMMQDQQSDSVIKMVQVLKVQGVHFSIKLHSGERLHCCPFGKLSQGIFTAKPPKASIKQNCQEQAMTHKKGHLPNSIMV